MCFAIAVYGGEASPETMTGIPDDTTRRDVTPGESWEYSGGTVTRAVRPIKDRGDRDSNTVRVFPPYVRYENRE